MLTRRSRLSVARLMGIVAISALILGGNRWWIGMRPEASARERMAAYHRQQLGPWRAVSKWVNKPELVARAFPNKPEVPDIYDHHSSTHFHLIFDPGSPARRSDAEFVEKHRDEIAALCRQRVEYHERMRRKWARASWFPWTRVEPDGPMPPISWAVPNADSY